MKHMKKIDLHLHTIRTMFDGDELTFSVELLNNYINKLNLDSVAITNHNLFDREQYDEIVEGTDIKVFPGVEVSVAKGPLLVIASSDDINTFEVECNELSSKFATSDDYITVVQFKEIFKNHSNYLLIPHYKKSPEISNEIIDNIGGITCGEVSSHKKFISSLKQEGSLVPVLFSDYRISEENKTTMPARFTFVDIDDITINNLKIALNDKNKVSLNNNGDNELIEALPDGTMVSPKLNLIVGKRSSGKTVTLKKLKSSFGGNEPKSVKYIEQFQITSESEQKFDSVKLEIRNELTRKFILKIDSLIRKVIDIDNIYFEEELERFVSSLKEHANSKSMEDVYSKSKIFNSEYFEMMEPNTANKVLKSIFCIFEEAKKEEKHGKIILKHIDLNNIKLLFEELLQECKNEYLEYSLKNESDNIVRYVKDSLAQQSTQKLINDIDFTKYYINMKSIDIFNETLTNNMNEMIVGEKDLFRFNAVAKVTTHKNLDSLKSGIKKPRNFALQDEYKSYRNKEFFSFLKQLVSKEINKELFTYAIFDFKLDIYNNKGNEISGGEKAEFNLLKHLSEYRRYEALFIDEPEASFDNVFLYKSVVKMLKEASKHIPVFVVTHNNTLGLALEPNHLLYTEFDDEEFENGIDKEDCFKIYCGSLTADSLNSVCGKKIDNYEVIIETMEAGEDAYNERKSTYENLKN